MSIPFDLNEAISILEKTPKALIAQLSGLSEKWLHSNEGENSWSPIQILGHLVHGEETDWLPRAKIILSSESSKEFEPYDRFAQEKIYADKNGKELLTMFEKKRNSNIKELKKLTITEKELSLKGIHPEFGEITLKEMLSSWVVHDLGHIAQINRVMAKNYSDEIGPWKKYLTIVRSKPAVEE